MTTKHNKIKVILLKSQLNTLTKVVKKKKKKKLSLDLLEDESSVYRGSNAIERID